MAVAFLGCGPGRLAVNRPSMATGLLCSAISRSQFLARTRTSCPPPVVGALPCGRSLATAAPTMLSEAAPDATSCSKSMFEPGSSFSALGISDEVVAQLSERNMTNPTRVQASVVPVLVEGLSHQMQYERTLRRAEAEFDAATVSRVEAVDDTELDAVNDAELGGIDNAELGGIDNARLGAPSAVPHSSEDVLEYQRPTPPEGDTDDVIMLGAETGSGKTLAYLLPYIEACRRNPDTPTKAIIMVPSRELCAQVARLLVTYFPDAPPHLVIAGGHPPDVSDIKTVRIVIATPAAVLNYFRFSQKMDGNDKYIVVDEADMLLTGSFCREVEQVLNQPGMKPFAQRKNAAERAVNRNRLIFVGATYPHWTGEKVKSIVTWMKKRYPNIRTLQTEAIHMRSTNISDQWHFMQSDEERQQKLISILSEECDTDEKVMIFCARADTAERVYENLLEAVGGEIGPKFGILTRLHKNVPSLERETWLTSFRSSESRLLVCTDIAARGLDLGNVTRVIEYDFSTNVVGYLHRIGRTARAGASGCTNHFYTESNRALAEAILERSTGNTSVVEGVFSRDRSFRRKLRKRTRENIAV